VEIGDDNLVPAMKVRLAIRQQKKLGYKMGDSFMVSSGLEFSKTDSHLERNIR
jgi:hypothetical protein